MALSLPALPLQWELGQPWSSSKQTEELLKENICCVCAHTRTLKEDGSFQNPLEDFKCSSVR